LPGEVRSGSPGFAQSEIKNDFPDGRRLSGGARFSALKGAALFILALVCVVFAAAPPLAAQPMVKPYSHFSDKEPIEQVLADFARREGYRASVSPAVVGSISGNFVDVQPQVFLEGLKSAFGVHWYVLGGSMVFFHESEYVTKNFFPVNHEPHQILDAARGSALLSPQLPLRLAGGGLTVDGPAAYVEAVMTEAERIDLRRPEQRMIMRVFKLNYAQADDVTIDNMDRRVTVPGVAAILNGMVSGGVAGTRVAQSPASVGGLMGRGLSARGAPEPEEEPSAFPQANIMADPRMNAVLVYDLEERMPYYERVIRDLDQEVHLVEIHAAIVDINTNFKRELGVDFQGTGSSGDFRFGVESSGRSGDYSPLPVMGTTSGPGTVASTVYTHGLNYFVARIQALEQEGEARLLGRPSVLTLDNQEATLENTTTYYIQVTGFEAVDLFKVDSGTVLRVTPHIIRGQEGADAIRLSVTVQDSQDSGGSASMAGTSMAIPPVKQTRINTQALIRSNQSLLIGGYYFESRQDDETGTPGLKDIPLLGRLFKTTTKNNSQMERMILITPRIIRLGDADNLPSHVDDEAMSRSPSQADYEPRRPVPAKGGCSARQVRP
jgi:type III secretion protein C